MIDIAERLRLRVADLLLNAAYFIAPNTTEGKRMREVLISYAPPWHCHYVCKGGWNVALREDCQHTRSQQ